MGIERVVRFPSGLTPGWPEIAAKLAASGDAPVLRMIDGLPAFPDETPDPAWQELRIGLAGGMAPVRRYLPDLLDRVLSGAIDPGRVFDLTLPMAESAEGYRSMDERRAIKVLLQP